MENNLQTTPNKCKNLEFQTDQRHNKYKVSCDHKKYITEKVKENYNRQFLDKNSSSPPTKDY